MALPTYDELATFMAKVSQEKGEWAGFPIPIADYRLVLEPRYPYQALRTCFNEDVKEDQGDLPVSVNSWYSPRWQATIVVWQFANGHAIHTKEIANRASKMLGTIGASFAWPMEAELKAMEKLATIIGPGKFRLYLTTGSFLESSKRSGVTYIFRKGRPTVAIRPTDGGKAMRVLCTLCLHPIGYYAGTWAGVMVPTDDVIAHLTMMRGCEEKFWANANQHHPSEPQSGL